MPSNNVVIRGISYRMGTVRAVQDLVGEGLSIEAVTELLEKGVKGFSVFDRPIADAVKECTVQSLSLAGISAAEIDTVILITESFSELFVETGRSLKGSFRDVRDQAFDLFYSLGIRNSSILCATYGGCTNFLQAILLAKALVSQGASRNVLLVAAEKFASTEARLMKEAVSIAGDGVAACVVNSDLSTGEGAYRIDYVSIAPYKNTQSGGDAASLLLEMFRAMKSAAADCYEACGRQPRDFKWVVLGDYNRQTSTIYGKLLGFPAENTFLENVGRFGHIPFDPLINICDLSKLTTLRPSDPILLFLCGPISCGPIALEAI